MVLKVSDLTGSSLSQGFQTLPSEISLEPGDVVSASGGDERPKTGKGRPKAGFNLPNMLEDLLQGGSIFTKDELSGSDADTERGVIDNIAQRQNVFAAFGLLNFLDAFSPGGVKKKDRKDVLKSAGGIKGKGKKKEESDGSDADEDALAAAERASIFNDLPEGLQVLIKGVPELGEAFDSGDLDSAKTLSSRVRNKQFGGGKK